MDYICVCVLFERANYQEGGVVCTCVKFYSLSRLFKDMNDL